MLRVAEVFQAFRDCGIGFYAGVPDSLLKSICAYISDNTVSGEHVITANEGNAVALAIGHYLASGDPALVYLQNSGLGNAINPLLSLADPEVYGVPMVVMIGWRGEPEKPDEPQHVKQGRVMIAMLEAMEYPYFVLDAATEQPRQLIAACCAAAREGSKPAILVVRAGTFEPYALRANRQVPCPLVREEAIQLVLDRLDDDAVVVSTTGKASREVFEYRAAHAQGHHRDFLTVGGMGHASLIALGIARQRSHRPVVCLDGDGAALMHLGAFTTIGLEAPPNFKHILLNNGCHDSVGGQPTAGLDVDLCRIALASGYRAAETAAAREEVGAAIERLLSTEGPALLEIRVRKGARPDLRRPTTRPADNKRALMEWLETAEVRTVIP